MRVVLAVCGLLCFPATIACDSARPVAADAGAVAVPVVAAPMPDRLVAEFTLRNPKEAWGAFRSGIGGTVNLLADSPAQVIANAVGVDPGISAALLQDAPIVGLVSSTEGHDPLVVLAVELGNVGKVLSDAGAPPSSGALVPLSSKGAGMRVAIAKRGYLIVGIGAGATDDELQRLSPYLLTKVAVDARRPVVLAGSIANRRTETGLWITGRDALMVEGKRNVELNVSAAKTALEDADKRQREAKGGRAPDFGDPEALIAKLVEGKDTLIKLVDQLAQVNAFVGSRDGEFVVDVELDPKPGSEFETTVKTSKTCAADAIGDEPQQSVVAYLVCESESDRKKSADAQVALVANVLGNRGGEEKKIIQVLAKTWADARGDRLTASLTLTGEDGRSFRIISPLGRVESADAARAALRDLWKRPLVSDALHAKFGGEQKLEGGTYALSIKRKTAPKELQVIWSTDHNQLLIAGTENVDASKIATLRSPKTKLIDAGTLSRELKLLDKDVLTAVVVQPLLVMVTKQQLTPQASMLSLSRDPSSERLVARAVMPMALARELIKLRTSTE